MNDDKFTWKKDDLKIEHPTGSGIFIPISEYVSLVRAEKARKNEEETYGGNTAGDGPENQAD